MVFSVLGGDKRQIYLSTYLQKEGHTVHLFGNDLSVPAEVHLAQSIDLAIQKSDIILLPYPCSKENIYLNAPFFNQPILLHSILEACTPDKKIVGGIIPNAFTEKCTAMGVQVIDFGQDEVLQILNAVPTAEEAIKIAIENTDSTLYQSNILITGFGRIGKILAGYLKALGANVTVAARKDSDMAWVQAAGYQFIRIEQTERILKDINIVFNTVPHLILNEKELRQCNPQVLIIDLASGGGVDFIIAKELNLQTIHALSLPGKSAPKTSAYFLYNTIIKLLN